MFLLIYFKLAITLNTNTCNHKNYLSLPSTLNLFFINCFVLRPFVVIFIFSLLQVWIKFDACFWIFLFQSEDQKNYYSCLKSLYKYILYRQSVQQLRILIMQRHISHENEPPQILNISVFWFCVYIWGNLIKIQPLDTFKFVSL